MSFKIDKEQQTIHLVMLGGRKLSGQVYLDASPTTPGESMRVVEFLNQIEEPFMPFTTNKGEFLILQKKSIILAEVDAKAELRFLDDPSQTFMTDQIEVTLVDETVLQGTFFIEPIEGLSRARDQLNRTRGFLTVAFSGKALLINADHVIQIRLTEQG